MNHMPALPPNVDPNGPNRYPARRNRGAGVARVLVALALIAVVITAGYFLTRSMNPRHAVATRGLTTPVIRGPLTVSIKEQGTVEALNPVVVASEVTDRVTVISMIEEGTSVRRGDILIELDGSEIEDEIIDFESRVENARASKIRAEQDLAITRNQAAADIAQAMLDVEFARIDLRKYWSGEYPNELRMAHNKITLSLAELEQARDRYEGSMKLRESEYISRSELETDKLNFDRAQLDYELAVEERRLLEKFTRIRMLRQLLSDIDQRELALLREEARAQSNIAQAEASVTAETNELNRYESELARLENQLELCTLRAPSAGTVVYPRVSRWDDPLKEGSTVRTGQELCYLPNSASMMVVVSIHETNLEQVRPGQPATITLEALNDSLEGRVKRIATHPDQQMSWLNPDLVVYRTEIVLDETPPGLRSGMTGEVEILVDHFDDVLQVPVQSVVGHDGKPTVWVLNKEGKTEAQPVELGMDNDVNVVIQSGIEEGQLVSLVPPLEGAGNNQTVSAGQQIWTPEQVTSARAAFEVVEAPELPERDQAIVDTLTRVEEESGSLDDLLPDLAMQDQALDVMLDVEDGLTPTISDELRAAVETGKVVMTLRMGQQRGFLTNILPDEDMQAEAAEAISTANAGQTPVLSDELKDTVLEIIKRFEQGGRGS